MGHIHSVYDTDKHFTIDPVTRKITNVSGKAIIVQGDHNSERLTFELPRYIDGHDMSMCNEVQVHYLNSEAVSPVTSAPGIYRVDDLQISPNSDDVVVLSWLVSGNATKYVGKLQFNIRFVCTSDGETVDYAWHTGNFTDIFVVSGIYNGEEIPTEQQHDAIMQLFEQLEFIAADAKFAVWYGTQAEFEKLSEKVENCVYLITDDTTVEDMDDRITANTADVEELKEQGGEQAQSINGLLASVGSQNERITTIEADVGELSGKFENLSYSVGSQNERIAALEPLVADHSTSIGNVINRVIAVEGHVSAVGDYIVSCGTEGDWTYRKWKSGFYECYCADTFGIQRVAAGGNAHQDFVFPITFVGVPKVNVELILQSEVARVIHYVSQLNNDRVTVNLVNTSTIDVTPTGVNISAVGRWK